MSDLTLPQRLDIALQRLTKWRNVFAGWQLGTRPKDDPEARAVKDHREVTILLRAEMNALLALLIEKNVFTLSEYQTALLAEALQSDQDMESRFPGYKSTDWGMSIDAEKAAVTTKGWKP
jgi:hypothetical protein